MVAADHIRVPTKYGLFHTDRVDLVDEIVRDYLVDIEIKVIKKITKFNIQLNKIVGKKKV